MQRLSSHSVDTYVGRLYQCKCVQLFFFCSFPFELMLIHCLQLQLFNKVVILVSVIYIILLNRVHLIFHRLRRPALTRRAKRMDWFGADIGLCERDASSNPSRNWCIIAILGDGRSFRTGHSQSARLYALLLQSSRRRAWTCTQIDWIFTDAWSIDWQRFRLDQDQSEYTAFSQMNKTRNNHNRTIFIIIIYRIRFQQKQYGKVALKPWKTHWTQRQPSQRASVKWFRCANLMKPSTRITTIMYVSASLSLCLHLWSSPHSQSEYTIWSRINSRKPVTYKILMLYVTTPRWHIIDFCYMYSSRENQPGYI